MAITFKAYRGHVTIVLLETLRDLMALVGNIIIPVLCFLFFVLPNTTVTQKPELSTEATLQLVAMISMSTCLFGFAMAIAHDRKTGFAHYLKTLPMVSFHDILLISLS